MSGENTDPRVEPGIGQSLEMARRSRGLSLWQVEQQTRIRSRYLHDLERENFDVLPAVYVLGSLKTYADFLGLDGAALSRQLKASLVEPDEPDAPEQLATIGAARDEDDEYEAAPVPAVGFDQLFLGMGVILVSILAVMTIVAAVAQGDESPISQIDQPSTPEIPSEIALAGNVRDEGGAKEAGNESPTNDENKRAQPEAPKDDEAAKEDESEKDDGDASRSASLFGDAEFVPMSPSSSPTTAASASASPTSASPSPAASPDPATAEPDDAPASTPPATTGASQGTSEDAPDASSPAPASSGGTSPQPGGGGAAEPAPAGEAEASDRISAEANRKVDEAFEEAGIVR